MSLLSLRLSTCLPNMLDGVTCNDRRFGKDAAWPPRRPDRLCAARPTGIVPIVLWSLARDSYLTLARASAWPRSLSVPAA